MRDEIVSYEIAHLAKQKGFIENCRYYYMNSTTSLKRWGDITSSHSNDRRRSCKAECSAPTQSLLQKWLREIHNFHVYCFPLVWKTNIIENYCFAIRDYNNSGKYYNEDGFSTYEEALEKGLRTALYGIKDESLS